MLPEGFIKYSYCVLCMCSWSDLQVFPQRNKLLIAKLLSSTCTCVYMKNANMHKPYNNADGCDECNPSMSSLGIWLIMCGLFACCSLLFKYLCSFCPFDLLTIFHLHKDVGSCIHHSLNDVRLSLYSHSDCNHQSEYQRIQRLREWLWLNLCIILKGAVKVLVALVLINGVSFLSEDQPWGKAASQ